MRVACFCYNYVTVYVVNHVETCVVVHVETYVVVDDHEVDHDDGVDHDVECDVVFVSDHYQSESHQSSSLLSLAALAATIVSWQRRSA